jgi:predicted RecB family nuclease
MPSVELQRRQQQADEHRVNTLDAIATVHRDAHCASSVEDTREALAEGCALILSPQLPDDPTEQRRVRVQALVRVGRVDAAYSYAPLLIKNSEFVESAATRSLQRATLAALTPFEAIDVTGVGPRATVGVTRAGITLAHATRLLTSLGFGDEHARGAVVDRHGSVWWLHLDDPRWTRFNLATYDRNFAARRMVLEGLDAWREGRGDYPTAPYWHRECLDCPFNVECEEVLLERDDVSLVRFSTFDQQRALREAGVATRHQLAALSPRRVRERGEYEDSLEATLAERVERLDELIYRARVFEAGSPLRTVESDQVACPTGDVEVDVDMESYGDRTYLWGATLRTSPDVEGFPTGYHAFAEWGELNDETESAVFERFWAWFCAQRTLAERCGLAFRAYCFWAQAEDGAMNRAVALGREGTTTQAELDAFRAREPRQWIDLHDQVKRQLQTEGPLGLKKLAGAAGFAWRDENPSGEASMLWYEIARGTDEVALASRQRILEYNEDDCRATQALRDWLNGDARQLPHRDDPTRWPEH